MRVFITGITGPVGSALATYLVELGGVEVHGFKRWRSDTRSVEHLLGDVVLHEGDIEDAFSIDRAIGRASPDRVYHLAAQSYPSESWDAPVTTFRVNVEGTLNVLEASREEEPRRIVHTSTSEVYGTAQHIPIDEEHPLHPQSPYAATKVGADQVALSYQRSFGAPVVVARPFNTYGPRQSARAVIPTIVSQALSRDVVELGATSPTRDFLYVEDTAAGIAACADADGVEGEVINLGTGGEISIRDVAERIIELVGRDVTLALDEERLRPPESEVERLVADTAKARRLLGWEPAVNLDEGLQRTIDWLAGSLDVYKPSLYNV
jgi:GDP-mannose 4,6-dehydratase